MADVLKSMVEELALNAMVDSLMKEVAPYGAVLAANHLGTHPEDTELKMAVTQAFADITQEDMVRLKNSLRYWAKCSAECVPMDTFVSLTTSIGLKFGWDLTMKALAPSTLDKMPPWPGLTLPEGE